MNLKVFALLLPIAIVPVFGQEPTAKSQPPTAKSRPASSSKTFDSPEAATQALIDAASTNDLAGLRAILGSSAKGILTSGDPKQDEAERQEFAKIATAKHHLEKSSMNARVMVLLVGDQDWPFPIPLMRDGDHWRFDPQGGSIEVRARQLGANELEDMLPGLSSGMIPKMGACLTAVRGGVPHPVSGTPLTTVGQRLGCGHGDLTGLP